MTILSVTFQSILLYLFLKVSFYLLFKLASSLLVRLIFRLDEVLVTWLEGRMSIRFDQGILRSLMVLHIGLDKACIYLFRFGDYITPNNIRNIFRIKLLDVVIFVFAYHICSGSPISEAAFLTKSNVIYFFLVLYNHYEDLNSKLQQFILMCIFAPVIYNIYLYLSFKLFRMDKCLIPYLHFFNNTNKRIVNNIDLVRRYKKEMIDNQMEELASLISYKCSDEVLVAYKKDYVYRDDKQIEIKQLLRFKDELQVLEEINKQSMIKHRIPVVTVRKLKGYAYKIFESYDGILHHEELIFLNKDTNYEIQQCSDYFSKNQNQIYKHKFTKARIIRTEVLKDLEYYEKRLGKIIRNLSKNLDSYYFCLVKNNIRLDSCLRKLSATINTHHWIDHVKVVLKNVIKDYLRIINKLII
ncbi:hypothetical protein PMSD_01185 [Paenibacillus macquariensis subsp. defensor]|nr:hypothetical protein PMSD_01185 [Paenibacillus macquariensis subsp. defensor]